MLNDKPRFYVYGIAAEEWTARYGIEPFSYPCSTCERMLTTTIPFVQGTLRGLQAARCECGNERTPYGIVRDPRFGDLLSGVETSGSTVGKRSAGRVLRWRASRS